MEFNPIQRTVTFFKYLFKKRSEIERLNFNDVLLAKTVLDIHRKKVRSEFVILPLYSIHPIHPIDREHACAETARRAANVRAHRQDFLEKGIADRELLDRYLTSVSWIKVIREDENTYVSFEGNRRIEAMKQVFDKDDNIRVEVELYTIGNIRKIFRRINRVRRYNGISH